MKARTIGVLAKEVGVSVETIRFYERTGLLKRPPQPPGGWRVYDEEAVRAVRYIRMARRMGFSLRSLGELGQQLRNRSDFCRDFHSALEHRLRQTEREMHRLARVHVGLTRIRARCLACSCRRECLILRRIPLETPPECRDATTSAKR